MKHVREYAGRMMDLLNEASSVISYRNEMISYVKKIESAYQKGRFGYLQYEELLDKTLKGRTLKEWDQIYRAQLKEVLKKVEYFNSMIFYESYKSADKVEFHAKKQARPLLGFLKRRSQKTRQKAEIRQAMEEMKKVPLPKKKAPAKLEDMPELLPPPKKEKYTPAVVEKKKPKLRIPVFRPKPAAKKTDEPVRLPGLNIPKPVLMAKKEKMPKETKKPLKHILFPAKAPAPRPAPDITPKKPLKLWSKKELEAPPPPEKVMPKKERIHDDLFKPRPKLPKPERVIEAPVKLPHDPELEEALEPIEKLHLEEEKFRRKPLFSGLKNMFRKRIEPRPQEEVVKKQMPILKIKEKPEMEVPQPPLDLYAEEIVQPHERRKLKLPPLQDLRSRISEGDEEQEDVAGYKPSIVEAIKSAPIVPHAEVEEAVPEKPKIKFKKKILPGETHRDVFDKIIKEENQLTRAGGKVVLTPSFGFNIFKHLMFKLGQKPTPSSKRKNLIEKDIRLKFLRTGEVVDVEKIEHVNSDILKKEAERVHQILTKERQINLYKPSVIGTVSNLISRDISYKMIENFPDFFRQLYEHIRLSNIRILSNTYINIMIFSTMVLPIISLFIFPIIFALQGNSPWAIIAKTLITSVLVGFVTFMSFYIYPTLKIKERKRNIRTNLPFAINHMAAIASSGVRPDILFKLVASSKEYGEICVEAEKINQLITIFGYDLLTAIKSVSDASPSAYFKEFLEGMIATIESGGNLEEYLSERSKEALLSYEIERQKYTETIGTLSDVYTGLLIAAPLFFVAALSLISILGGGIGGIPVDIIIATGTYIVIPMLNVIFIVFVEISQPEV